MSDPSIILLVAGVLLIGYGLGARRWPSGVTGVALLLAWLFADLLSRMADSRDDSIF